MVTTVVILVAVIGGLGVTYELGIWHFPAQPGSVITTTTQQSTGTQTQWQTQTQYVTPSNNVAPTMLTVAVSPNPMNMRGFFLGTVTSDGQNYGITITYTTPNSVSQSLRALLGPDGKFTATQQLNLPGEYVFTVRADNGVVSNTATLQVNGVYINVEPNSVSRMFRRTITIEVATGMYRSNFVVTASRDGWATSIVIITGRVDARGYATWTGDFDPLTLGNYEFDVTINGQTARSYGASDWVNAGR